MGATLSTESVLTTAVVVGALGVGYHQYANSPADGDSSSTQQTSSTVTKQTSKKKKQQKKGLEDKKSGSSPQPLVSAATTPSAIPGQFDDPNASSSSKPKKSKNKKKKAQQPPTTDPASTSASTPTPVATKKRPNPLQASTTSIDTDGSWTRVESKKKVGKGGSISAPSVDVTTTSDAGITSSVAETQSESSPVEEEEAEGLTLAEKLVPKPPKLDVDDMLPEHPTLARVMRIQPLPNERPAPGFSWGDYDNVDDTDGDDGWGVVKSKRSTRPKREAQQQQQLPVVPQQSGETLTKKQRQNANKREAQKAAKAAAEADRLATLAKHKRELERTKMIEQSRSSKKGQTSGGMTSVVDGRGKLVWE